MTAPLQFITQAGEWDSFMEHFNAHILQSYEWGEFKSQFGWRAERVAWRDGSKILAAAQILYRRLAPALTVAYIPRGPVADPANLPSFLEQLKEHVRARGVFLLKIEPDWQRGDERENLFREFGAFQTSETIQPPITIHIDLTADLETILARMKSKWRYNIRLAQRKDIVVRSGTLANFDSFYALMRKTGERDHFAIHGADYYRTAFELFRARDGVRLFVAEYRQSALAMIFVTAFAHEAIYLYGASSNLERNRMPNHALHWSAIQWAKARGCTRYDLWGIPEEVAQTNDDANLPSSLYQFKQGFGGEIVRYSGAWDFVFNQPLYQFYKLARKTYQRGLA